MKTNTSLSELLEELFALQRFGIKPGLERTAELCRLCDSPEQKLRAIHVAGTNGKGTVCSALAAAYSAAGYRVGLYTSPHIHRFNERLRINGEIISDEKLLQYCRRIMPSVRAIGATFFEATTVLAFCWFAEQTVDISIIETGLGGRFDATNVLPPPSVLCSVITSIDLDHEEYLGSTVEQICREKAGIIKHGVPVVVAEERTALVKIIQQVAELHSAPCIVVGKTEELFKARYHRDCTMQVSLNKNEPEQWFSVPLSGEHQVRNLSTAYTVLEQGAGRFPVHNAQFFAGLADLEGLSGLRARITRLRAEPPVIVDVGHNPAGLRALLATLELCGYSTTQWTCIFTAMHDKNLVQMIEILAPIVQHLIIPKLSIPRATDPEQLSQLAMERGINVSTAVSVAHACSSALAENAPLLIVGSFYLVDEALLYLESLDH